MISKIMANVKLYLWGFLLFVFIALMVTLQIRGRKLDKLELKLRRKIQNIEVQKEVIKEQEKKADFERSDLKENLEVVKDFEAIDNEVKNEKETIDNDNSDNFSFNA
jgi:hypothetical protein